MNHRIIIVFIAVVIVAAVVAGVVYFDRPARPTLTTDSTSTGGTTFSLDALPVATLGPRSAEGKTPVIVWTPASVFELVVRGESKVVSIALVSMRNVRRASVQVSPELARFVRAEPAFLERIRKGQSHSIKLIVTTPSDNLADVATGTVRIKKEGGDSDEADEEQDSQKEFDKPLPVAILMTDVDSVPSFEYLRAQPSIVRSDEPTEVIVKAKLTQDPNLTKPSVVLLKYMSGGTTVDQVGQMSDDGTNGDEVAGDNVFTLRLSLVELGPGTVILRASAAYQGLRRVLSAPLSIPVAVQGSAEETRRGLADSLLAGDLDGAYNRLGDRLRDQKILDGVEPEFLNQLAEAARTCRIVDQREYLQVCEAQAFRNTRGFRFLIVKDAFGNWRVMQW